MRGCRSSRDHACFNLRRTVLLASATVASRSLLARRAAVMATTSDRLPPVRPPACLRVQTGHFSGILGLGFASMSAYGVVPVMDSIVKKNLLKYNAFSFYLSRWVQ